MLLKTIAMMIHFFMRVELPRLRRLQFSTK
ncbi:hypothetical protein X778_25525 [Pseudomonas aeruginosa VRFPA07]|nr:hypothetical protein X778_25525 [Pseudomonas aeruginosa VRFPA07]